MMDDSVNTKLDRILTLMESQLELSRQAQCEERLCCARLSEEDTMMPPPLETRELGDEPMAGDPPTPNPASCS